MATDQTLQFNLNLNPQMGEKGMRQAKANVVDKFMFDMETMIIDNVAFVMADGKKKELISVVNTELGMIVQKELSRMARQIAQYAVGIPGKATQGKTSRDAGQAVGPPGTLAITGPISTAMQAINTGPFSLVSGTGPWPARSPKYMQEKRKKFGHAKWFYNTGDLQKVLKNPNTYTSAYGPVKASFRPESVAPPGIRPTRVSSGAAGRTNRRVMLGQLRVSALGRITDDMLSEPGSRQPSAWDTGLFSSLDPKVEEKLLNRQDAYRPFLEHFLSFYLTRAIPNAVFRRLEQVMTTALGKSKGPSKRFSSKNVANIAGQLKTK